MFVFIVGHKCDSDDKVRKVEKKAAQRIAKRCGAIDYIEASSTDDINVDQVLLLNLSGMHNVYIADQSRY